MKNKDGEENVLEEICPKFSKKFKCFSAGIYEDESGMTTNNNNKLYYQDKKKKVHFTI